MWFEYVGYTGRRVGLTASVLAWWCVVAIQARVETSQQVGDWMKLGVSVINIFKKGKEKLRRGDQPPVWVPLADFRCRCPRLRTRQTYLIIGNELMSATRAGLVVDRSSAVHKWREQLGRRLRRRMERCWADDSSPHSCSQPSVLLRTFERSTTRTHARTHDDCSRYTS